MGGAQAFSTRAHLKLVSPKWRENSVGGVLWLNDKIAHCTNFVPLSFFLFLFSSACFPGRLLLLRHLLLLLLFSLPGNVAYFFFLILFSFDFLGRKWCYVFFFFFILYIIFFPGQNFYFLINLGDCFFLFFGFLLLFYFNCASFFNKGI